LFKDQIPRCSRCNSLVKPDITFFGESLPRRYFNSYKKDFRKCDFLIVIGTSLKVAPFCGLVDKVRKNVPRVLINDEMVYVRGTKSMEGIDGGFEFDKKYRDVACLGDCQQQVIKLCQLLGWKDDLFNLIPKDNCVLQKVLKKKITLKAGSKVLLVRNLQEEKENIIPQQTKSVSQSINLHRRRVLMNK
jgi:NAD-dependent deacetylase sirtuin 2